MKEFSCEDREWKVYYTREDGQKRLATRCGCPSEAEAIKKKLEDYGAKGCTIMEIIKIKVYGL